MKNNCITIDPGFFTSMYERMSETKALPKAEVMLALAFNASSDEPLSDETLSSMADSFISDTHSHEGATGAWALVGDTYRELDSLKTLDDLNAAGKWLSSELRKTVQLMRLIDEMKAADE